MAEKMTVEKATDILQKQGFHCSQCVLWHSAETLGLDKDLAVKMSGGLGGGCFAGGTCGAVTGAVITLGLKYGFNTPGAAAENAALIDKVHEFEERYIAKYGSIECKEQLGGMSFAVPEEAARIMTEGFVAECPARCAYACEILDDMIEELK